MPSPEKANDQQNSVEATEHYSLEKLRNILLNLEEGKTTEYRLSDGVTVSLQAYPMGNLPRLIFVYEEATGLSGDITFSKTKILVNDRALGGPHRLVPFDFGGEIYRRMAGDQREEFLRNLYNLIK